jgi:chaperonin GroES
LTAPIHRVYIERVADNRISNSINNFKALMVKEAKKTNIKVQPLGDRVLVKREDAPEKKSISGIIIPDAAQKEKSKRGIVVAAGVGRMNDDGMVVPMSVEVGAKVYFNAGWDNEVDLGIEGEEYFLVKESDILAVIK